MRSEAFPISVDHYVGAYGPTVRIEAKTLDALRSARDMFNGLAKGPTTELVISNGAPTGIGFEWGLDQDGWRDSVAMIGRLLQSGRGHQYLTREGVDDALVEFVYGE